MAKNSSGKNGPGNRAEEKALAAQKRESRREKAAKQAAALEAARAAQQRKERLIVGGVVFVVLAIIALGMVWALNSGPSDDTAAPPANAVDDFALVIGEDDAPNTVEVYSDFLCPSCAQWDAHSGATLYAAVDEGQVQLKYYPITVLEGLDNYPVRAANAFGVVLDAAGPEVAQAFHDSLFAEQPGQPNDPNDDDWLIAKAVEAGADEDDVRDGIEDLAFEKWVANSTEAASKRGVRSTPSVFLNDELFDHGQGVDALVGAFN